jgi:hypothetical protein
LRTNRVISRHLALQEKDYTLYGPDECEKDKRIHIGYLMQVCQTLARFGSAFNISLRECEAYRSANFEQQKYTLSEADLSILSTLPLFSPEQSIWYAGVRGMLVHSIIIARTSLRRVQHPEASPSISFHESPALLWTCIYERIEAFGFQMERCLEQSQNGEFIERTGYGQ